MFVVVHGDDDQLRRGRCSTRATSTSCAIARRARRRRGVESGQVERREGLSLAPQRQSLLALDRHAGVVRDLLPEPRERVEGLVLPEFGLPARRNTSGRARAPASLRRFLRPERGIRSGTNKTREFDVSRTRKTVSTVEPAL